jgi:hypothetical protein
VQRRLAAGGTVGSAYSFTASATGSPTPTYALTSGALPGGLSLNTTSGAITGTPNAGGTFNSVVTATNAGGSCTINIAITIGASVPGAPTIGTGTPGPNSATVAFTAPASNGGSAITSFTATCGAQSQQGAASPITVTGLAGGVPVSCSVKANNAVGSSAASASVNVTPTSVPAFTSGAAPGGTFNTGVLAHVRGERLAGADLQPHLGRVPGRPDPQFVGRHAFGHAERERHLHGRGDGDQLGGQRHAELLDRDRGDGAGRADDRFRDAGQQPGFHQLHASRLERRLGDHRIYRDLQPGRSHGHCRGIPDYGVGPYRRNDVCVLRHGDQRRRQQRGVGNGERRAGLRARVHQRGAAQRHVRLAVRARVHRERLAGTDLQRDQRRVAPRLDPRRPEPHRHADVGGHVHGRGHGDQLRRQHDAELLDHHRGHGAGRTDDRRGHAGAGQATIAFTPPANNGGAAVSSFTATCNPGAVSAPGAASPITVTGLTSGTPYTCSVTATNSAGTSAPSGTVGVTPGAAPSFTSAAPVGGTYNVAYSHTYTANGAPAPTFAVTSGALPPGLTLSSGGALTGTPTTGGTFTGVVTASNSIGNATQSFSITIGTTLPGAPTIGAGTPGPGFAMVGFTPPAANGGTPITSYTATCTPGPFGGSAAASPVTVNGLTNGTTYTCSVTATNAVGTGPASGTVTVTPAALPAFSSAPPPAGVVNAPYTHT